MVLFWNVIFNLTASSTYLSAVLLFACSSAIEHYWSSFSHQLNNLNQHVFLSCHFCKQCLQSGGSLVHQWYDLFFFRMCWAEHTDVCSVFSSMHFISWSVLLQSLPLIIVFTNNVLILCATLLTTITIIIHSIFCIFIKYV